MEVSSGDQKIELYFYYQGNKGVFNSYTLNVEFPSVASSYRILIPTDRIDSTVQNCKVKKEELGAKASKGMTLTADKVEQIQLSVLTENKPKSILSINFQAELKPKGKYAIILQLEEGLIKARFVTNEFAAGLIIEQKKEKILQVFEGMNKIGCSLYEKARDTETEIPSGETQNFAKAYIETSTRLSAENEIDRLTLLTTENLKQEIVSYFRETFLTYRKINVPQTSGMDSSMVVDQILSSLTVQHVQQAFIRTKNKLEKIQTQVKAIKSTEEIKQTKYLWNQISPLSTYLRTLTKELQKRGAVLEGFLTGVAAPELEQYLENIKEIFDAVFNPKK